MEDYRDSSKRSRRPWAYFLERRRAKDSSRITETTGFSVHKPEGSKVTSDNDYYCTQTCDHVASIYHCENDPLTDTAPFDVAAFIDYLDHVDNNHCHFTTNHGIISTYDCPHF